MLYQHPLQAKSKWKKKTKIRSYHVKFSPCKEVNPKSIETEPFTMSQRAPFDHTHRQMPAPPSEIACLFSPCLNMYLFFLLVVFFIYFCIMRPCFEQEAANTGLKVPPGLGGNRNLPPSFTTTPVKQSQNDVGATDNTNKRETQRRH